MVSDVCRLIVGKGHWKLFQWGRKGYSWQKGISILKALEHNLGSSLHELRNCEKFYGNFIYFENYENENRKFTDASINIQK